MTLRTGARWLASLAFASLTGTSAALAQTASAPAADAPSPGPAFGTASLSSVTLGPYAFSPVRNDVQWDTSFIDNNVFVFHTGISSLRETTFEVPNGALIEQVGIRFCDSSDTAQFTSTLRIEDSSGGPAGFIPLVASTMAETPGCVYRTATLAPSIQVDNAAKVYSLELILDTTAGSNIAFGHARILYRLQVSPAPQTATFGDVPVDHQFFRFVEALAAAGITGGCGGGNFCPNNPVTRGQMAAFLSIALGLHFPG